MAESIGDLYVGEWLKGDHCIDNVLAVETDPLLWCHAGRFLRIGR